MTHGPLSLFVPDTLVTGVDQYGTLNVSADSSYWLSFLSVQSSPLESVNGFPDDWNDMAGYFRFIDAESELVLLNGMEWHRLRQPGWAALFAVRDGFLNSVGRDFGGLVSVFDEVIEAMIASVCWTG